MLFNRVESILKVCSTQQHSHTGSPLLLYRPLVADRAQLHFSVPTKSLSSARLASKNIVKYSKGSCTEQYNLILPF